MKKIIKLFCVFITLIPILSFGQYKEIVFSQIPVGDFHYFRLGYLVEFKLKSDYNFSTYKGRIKSIATDRVVIDSIIFTPDNLNWIRDPEAKSDRIIKIIGSSVMAVAGVTLATSGIVTHSKSVDAGTDNTLASQRRSNGNIMMSSGAVLLGAAVFTFRLHPKNYVAGKKYRMRFQQ